jgi:hypothetical protein
MEDPVRGVVGNERLTALVSAVLLGLILVELATMPDLSAAVPLHVFVGVAFIGPLTVKLASTGYRFLRYYGGADAFVRKGPPRLALRLLAPALVLMTALLVATGLALLVVGPADPAPFEGLHNLSFVLWLPLVAVHAVAYLARVPRLLADDWRRGDHAIGRWSRLDLTVGAILFGAIAAVVALPAADPWAAPGVLTQVIPGPVVASGLLTLLVLLAVRPLRWRDAAPRHPDL